MPQPADAFYDPEAERATSAEILEQARWLFEHHEERSENARRSAAAVLTAAGALVALVSRLLPAESGWWPSGLMVLIGVSGLITIALCVGALIPRGREKGMPGIKNLRRFARAHDQNERLPVAPTQFMVDLLNTANLDEDSPLDHAKNDANARMKYLARAYLSLAVTFAFTIVLTVSLALYTGGQRA